ncbi:hypothetical protein FAF44_26565 [Nonomuraea sp. MG754425]|uniref:hypothetical protein n=1 Tax=Nonomuraea sp. MG754425 TaxID=2570319 RepID=UPI001F2053B5|nr:hypothetical protein [Nonomuraea sp. MG754425]MCF6471927.1 hypothetical protein [Nonomuraea sp. MG754425]
MTGKKLLTEVSGVVAAPVEQVWRELLGDLPGQETGRHTLAHQGGWWYRGEWSVAPHPEGTRVVHRGEWSVAPHPEGTRVVHRVYNVAEWMRWGVPLANRFFIGFEKQTRTAFAEGLAAIGERLGCPTRLA